MVVLSEWSFCLMVSAADHWGCFHLLHSSARFHVTECQTFNVLADNEHSG